MAFASTSRAIWLSTFVIIICLYFTLNSETFNGTTTIRAGGNTQAPVVETPLTPEEASCKKLGMIKEASCPVPDTPYFKAHDSDKTPDDQRPLITYAYYESPFARANLKFFVDHALHDAADFIFILNGETDADKTIIFADSDVPEDLRDLIPRRDKKNIFVKKRPNTCFDLGAHNEVLNSVLGGEGWIGKDGPIAEPKGMVSAGDNMLLRNKYKRYILMNASIRGPFVPRWSTQCWTDSYLNRLTDRIKLVGMSYNCHNGEGHIQSMIWATDHTGLQVMLTKAGIGECFGAMSEAMLAEVRTTQVLRDAGFEVDNFMSVYHSENRAAKYARMRAKKAKGIKQFKRGEIEAGAEAEAPELVTRETEEEKKAKEAKEAETKAKKEKEEKEAKEKKDKEAAAAAAAAAAATPTTTHIPTASEVAAAKAAEEERVRQEAAAKAAAEEKARIEKEKNDKLLLIEDNDMPGYFWRECKHEDWLGPGSYFGTFVHPYENLFMKSHRKIEDTVLDNLTKWHDGWGYESYDVCF
ncbi:hypothetical protein VE01_02358 [Pseudogymnoascus verrucosus]|uniref:Uncharacterized protein n=1 Tax=Pseudogymnoascus verrucosus TaxID=342668 RepID=A0A1B8GT22_9PEZI|nr:uncharacterized protein VE01_02358 [Pseudogymnoascus verrucosus]OBT98977.2 hypothetical protein VE01_02358 [Pseudogymnoascus verrucosus]